MKIDTNRQSQIAIGISSVALLLGGYAVATDGGDHPDPRRGPGGMPGAMPGMPGAPPQGGGWQQGAPPQGAPESRGQQQGNGQRRGTAPDGPSGSAGTN